MARKLGLTDFNLSLIRLLMRSQELTTLALSEKVEVNVAHLSRVLNRHSPLSEQLGKKIAEALGVSWDVIKKPESQHYRDLIHLALADFFSKPDRLDWRNAVKLSEKMGILYFDDLIADSEPSEAEQDDADLLDEGDVPDAYEDKK